MKTFTLPDSIADALIATGKEMAHQNNRSTAWPIWYVIDLDEHGEFKYASYGSGMFLTAAACEEYIRENSYHFENPKAYCASLFRNDEMQPVIQALILMAGEEVPSNHYGRVQDDN